jgi:alpha-L-rhamnosidase
MNCVRIAAFSLVFAYAFCFSIPSVSAFAKEDEIQAHSLRVSENFADPIGFYDSSPVLSWKLPVADEIKSQSAYRIVVTNKSATDSSAETVWDSGKVDSDQSVWVPYGGPELQSRQRVFWRVKFWDNEGRESAWSKEASIEMGLLANADWGAKWIEVSRPAPADVKVKVLKAEFGNKDEGSPPVADVAQRLNQAIKNSGKPVRAVTRRLGGDPAPGKTKTLWVEYEVNGEKKSAVIPEKGLFDPFPPIVPQPGYYLRREFEVPRKVVKARLYASALGIYSFYINGKPVSDDVLSPGYTTYSKRVETLTYDVTSMLGEGSNAIGASLGEGWYAGNLLLRERKELQALTPKLLGQLELTYDDGTVEKISTDQTWKGTDAGPIIAGGLYHGEDYDARKEFGDWSSVGFDDDSWKAVKSASSTDKRLLVPKRLPPVKVMQEVQAVKLSEPESGKYVFDFGQNLVGVPSVKLPVKSGETVTFRFAEMLEKNGTLYTTNYRSARSQASYIAATDGVIEWEPSLTFFGFRYLEISGLSRGSELTTESATAKVYHTDFESTGSFTSSHAKLNQLQQNIRWGQISNFIDVPTDCPQRDERLGWTGDAQVFCPTSFFNYDVHSFWSRWLQSVRDDQTDEGKIPHTVPATNFGTASPGWADVIVTAPWDIYVRTGDVRILRDNYDAMKKWVAVYERDSEGLIPTTKGFGDWLQPYTKTDNKGDTAQDLIATAYFGRDARILTRTAKVLGNAADATKYQKLHSDIRTAFSKRYFTGDDAAAGADTQTACLMGLAYDLIEPNLKDAAIDRLMGKFEEADRHLRTGFLGTPLLAPVFDELGHPEICFELLFKESYPSWFFPINQGATTMWERWNSYSHADGFGNANMNSFNHYAYGAIGQFMYERVAGLSPDPANPGYKHFFIRPLIGGPLDSASAELETPYGKAKSGWKKSDGQLSVAAIIPPNTTATCVLPATQTAAVRVNGMLLSESNLKFGDVENGQIEVTVGPGSYGFEITTVEGGAQTDHPDEKEFVQVFDGKTLNGWSGHEAYWSVEDGALTGVTDGSLKTNSFITWQGSTIKNFELRVKVKVTARGNSGLQYRGKVRPDLGSHVVTGYQCDIVASVPKYNGMLYEERGRRILSHTGEKVIVDPTGQPWVVGKLPVKKFAPDQWHDYRVIVEGNHHRHWIDGHLTADLIDLDEKGRALEGVLAVQVHKGPAMKIQYKDFKIKHLSDDLPLQSAADHPISSEAYGVRPQGKLPKDWKAPVHGQQQSETKESGTPEPTLKKVDIDFELADGASWDGSRALFVPDVKGGVLWRVPTEKDASHAKKRLKGKWAISGTCHHNGILYFADSGKRKLFRLGQSGPPEEIAAFAKGQKPNDLVIDRGGNTYITFSREGVVRRVAVDGKVSIVVTDLVKPNGIGLSPDFKTIYVSSSKTGQLVAAKIDPSKDRFEPSAFAQLPKTEIGFRGDGMTVDRAGNVYCTGGRSVCVFDPRGKMIEEIVTKTRPINVVFGGDIQRQLYISTFDGLYVMPRDAYGICPMPAVDTSGIEVTQQIPYADIEGRKLFMDVYRPSSRKTPDSAPKLSPAVIVVHGGGWVKGAKEKFAAFSASNCRRGYVVANIEYRLAHEAKFPAAIRDCNAAMAYLHTHATELGIDPNRIAVVGGSAGGQLAGLMAAGTKIPELRHASIEGSTQVASVVVLAGPIEISPGRVADQSIAQPEKSFAVVWFGGDAKQKPAMYKLADVATKMDATMPPVLFLTGSKDNPDKNKAVQAKLESLGVATDLSIVEGAKHAQWNAPQFMPMFVEAIDRFLKKNL